MKKLSCLKRLDYLFDKDSVSFNSENITFKIGSGNINKKSVYFIAIDSEKSAKSPFEEVKNMNIFLGKILEKPAPLILLSDTPGFHSSAEKSQLPNDAEQVLADKFGIGAWYFNHSKLSGKVPQVSAIFDKMGAALTFPPLLNDFTILTENAGLSIGRIDVVKQFLRENITYEELGGAKMHSEVSGSIDFIAKSEEKALRKIKDYLKYMPDLAGNKLPKLEFEYNNIKSIEEIIPDNPMKMLNIDLLINEISDTNSFFELRQNFAKEVITGFATFNGNICGIIANRSSQKGGIFFPESIDKTIHFISICDSFGIPLVFLSDSPGFMVGLKVEQQGIIKKASKLFQKISNSDTAILSVIIRRSYTAGLYAMAGGGMNADRIIALPSAIISIYGESVLKQLTNNSDENEKEIATQMLKSSKNPEYFLRSGMIDAIIKYEELRNEIFKFISKFQDGKRASKKPIEII
jgi:acetyl-CoA carboxylase carboxyltransferase component